MRRRELGVPGALSGVVPVCGAGDIRRLWPEVLEAVKSKRRFAWIMLSQNAQVIGIDEQTLTLGLVNAGARESFARSGSDEILRQAMIDTIGLNRRIEAVVDPSTDPGGGGGQHAGGPRAGGPQAGSPGSGGPAQLVRAQVAQVQVDAAEVDRARPVRGPVVRARPVRVQALRGRLVWVRAGLPRVVPRPAE